jgi:hypothetical protein
VKDDREWVLCLEEAGIIQPGLLLKRLFAIILLHSFPVYPKQL